MRYFLLLFALFSLWLTIFFSNKKQPKALPTLQTIMDIATPTNYKRQTTLPNTFAYFLQHFPLQNHHTVYLYTGAEKANQQQHIAVLNLSIGNKNLQQCADAVVRLRAEYFFAKNKYDSIVFVTPQKNML
jgi:hypothetical protein